MGLELQERVSRNGFGGLSCCLRLLKVFFFLHMLISVQDLKGLGYEKGKPVGLVGVTELSEAQKKQLKEQQEVMP